MILALLHGGNGVRWMIDDYVHSDRWRLIAFSTLYTTLFVLLVVGSLILLTFQYWLARGQQLQRNALNRRVHPFRGARAVAGHRAPASRRSSRARRSDRQTLRGALIEQARRGRDRRANPMPAGTWPRPGLQQRQEAEQKGAASQGRKRGHQEIDRRLQRTGRGAAGVSKELGNPLAHDKQPASLPTQVLRPALLTPGGISAHARFRDEARADPIQEQAHAVLGILGQR